MKSLTFLAAFLLLLSYLPTQANSVLMSDPGELLVKIKHEGKKSFHLSLGNLQGKKTKVTISDLNGLTIFTKVIEDDNAFDNGFDFSEYRKGRFIMKIEQGNQVISQVFAVQRNGEMLFAKLNRAK